MAEKKLWSVIKYSHESLYGEYLWDTKTTRIRASREGIKRYLCEQAGIAEDEIEGGRDSLYVELEGLETAEAHTVFVASPEKDVLDREAFDIVWETDGEEAYLPESVYLPEQVRTEDSADYLSDRYGFLVKSFTVREL